MIHFWGAHAPSRVGFGAPAEIHPPKVRNGEAITSTGGACAPQNRIISSLNRLPPAGLGPIGVAVIFGADELMDVGRTCMNLIGDHLATVVAARWEGELDDKRAAVFGTPKEIEFDLQEGESRLCRSRTSGLRPYCLMPRL